MSQTPNSGGSYPDDLLERYEAWREQSTNQDTPPPEFAQLAAGSALLRETLHQEVEAVPDMAFSAMWKRVEAEIEAEASASWWSRAKARWTSGWRMPATALAGACSLALVWFVVQPEGPGVPDSPDEPQMRSAMLPEAPQGSAKLKKASAPRAVAMQEAAPNPPRFEPGFEGEYEAEPEPEDGVNSAQALGPMPMPQIERIDFAQGGGRIERIEHAQGTTTVVWIDARAKKGPRGSLGAKHPKNKAMEL